MHACLSRAISRFGATADANDVGGGLATYWKICLTGLGPIWYVTNKSCLVDGHPRVEGCCETRDEARDSIAGLRDYDKMDEQDYEIVVRDHPVGDCRLEWGEPFDIDDEHNMDADTAGLCGFA